MILFKKENSEEIISEIWSLFYNVEIFFVELMTDMSKNVFGKNAQKRKKQLFFCKKHKKDNKKLST